MDEAKVCLGDETESSQQGISNVEDQRRGETEDYS